MITKCKNGHWYDSSVDADCPHCRREGERLGIRLDDLEEDDHTVSFAEIDLPSGFEIPHQASQESAVADMEEDDKTISFSLAAFPDMQQPVTGWLVCAGGVKVGRDYRLHAGKNFIGRSDAMDIVLADDKMISRERHAAIIYDPKGNGFYVFAENGNTIYVNGNIVNKPVRLKEDDVVIIGETKLVFVPFCKEGRIW